MQATQGNDKGKDQVSSIPLLCSEDVFAHRQFTKLSVRVEQNGHANVFATSQEAELGTSKITLEIILAR